MTGTFLTNTERSNLRIFRSLAAEVRAAFYTDRTDFAGLRIVDGYIQSDKNLERVRNLCVPVRRTYLKTDPVNFNRILDVVCRTGREQIHERSVALVREFEPIREELESASILNDRRITHAEIFEVWIDAMVLHEMPDTVRRYEAMVRDLGKVVEGIAMHLGERIAEQVLKLDDLVADFLGEPRAEVPSGPA